jgi:hypothetical protein
VPSENGDTPKKNGRHFTKIGPRFGREKPAIPGPGRPRTPADVKEARQILKDAAPGMAKRIQELAHHRDPDIAIKAIKVGLDKVLPNLEEVETHDDRPLQQFTDEQLERKLAQINASTNGHSNGNGAPA